MRLEILRSLEKAFEFRTEGYEPLLLGSDHCLDALVAALTAQEYAGGHTLDPPEHVSEETLKVEGWIRIPNHSIKGASGT